MLLLQQLHNENLEVNLAADPVKFAESLIPGLDCQLIYMKGVIQKREEIPAFLRK